MHDIIEINDNFKNCKKWLGIDFELTRDGPYNSEDFKAFAKDYFNGLKKMCKNNGWELVNKNVGYFELSTFIKNKMQNDYVYLSIPDVRYVRDGWAKDILIRVAKNEKDYHGLSNHYTSLNGMEIESEIDGLFTYMVREMEIHRTRQKEEEEEMEM